MSWNSFILQLKYYFIFILIFHCSHFIFYFLKSIQVYSLNSAVLLNFFMRTTQCYFFFIIYTSFDIHQIKVNTDF